MKNSIKYNFEDFTHKHYRNLLELVSLKYIPVCYSDKQIAKNSVYWRHDVDFSLNESLNLARIEKEYGLVSTYFLLPHCEFYSLLEIKSVNIIKQILSLGHKIGLHLDTHFYGVTTEEDLEQIINFEKILLEKIFDTEIEAFSFHNTTDFTMSCKKWKYAGLINTYASFFQEETDYCSDSNGYWRHKRLWDFLNESHAKPIQVLTHPGWWTSEIMSPKQKIDQIINDRATYTKQMYDSSLILFNRENIDW